MELSPGTRLRGRYRIERATKRGATSRVYLAWDLNFSSEVAIKEFDHDAAASFGDSEIMLKRFEQEALITRRLSHPHIIAIYDFFQENNTSYIVMPYLPETLDDRLGHLTLSQAIRMMDQICDGVAYAHEFHPNGNTHDHVVHCDLKPNNILFDHDQVKIADFGIAHVPESELTHAMASSFGTLFYMPPEQLDGVRSDPRVDVYAIGALFYQMLAGGRYYLDFEESYTDDAYLRNYMRIHDEMPLFERLNRLPAPLVAILRRALAKDPRDRYATAREMLGAIRTATQPAPDETATAKPAQPPTAESDEVKLARKFYADIEHSLDGDQTAVQKILELYTRSGGNAELRRIALDGIHHVAELALAAADEDERVWKAWGMMFLCYPQIKPWLPPDEDRRFIETLHELEQKLVEIWSSEEAGWADVSGNQREPFRRFVTKFIWEHAPDVFAQPYMDLVNFAYVEWSRIQLERTRPRGLRALLAALRRPLAARPALYAGVLALMVLSCAASYIVSPPRARTAGSVLTAFPITIIPSLTSAPTTRPTDLPAVPAGRMSTVTPPALTPTVITPTPIPTVTRQPTLAVTQTVVPATRIPITPTAVRAPVCPGIQQWTGTECCPSDMPLWDPSRGKCVREKDDGCQGAWCK